MELSIDLMASPIGDVLIITDGARLVALDFADCEPRILAWLRRRYGEVALRGTADPLGVASRLRAYFAGDYAALDAIPLDTGGSEFQRRVWAVLQTIAVGTTTTYGRLARRLGQPTASRAVGLANSQNPVAIVIPCHRVIGANAQLVGYAGGLARKRWLLEHERAEAVSQRRLL